MGKQRTIQSFFALKPAGAGIVAAKRPRVEEGEPEGSREVKVALLDSGNAEKAQAISGVAAPGEVPLGDVQLAATCTGRRTGRRVSALRAAACLGQMDGEVVPNCSPLGKGLASSISASDVAPQLRRGIQGVDVEMMPPKRRKIVAASQKPGLPPARKESPPASCGEVHRNQLPSCSEKVPRAELSVSLQGDIADRFAGRDVEKFQFLGKSRRDAAGRKPDHPDYDPTTLLLPPQFLKGLPAGQRQWWEIKGMHMDKVLLFKMGKFYEMFEVDAHIGAQELDLQYMKGEQPHCGFPEKNYLENVTKLAQKGYRVVVVEQTETPDQLEQRRKETGAKDRVVRREICAIITKGTMTESSAVSETSYLMSITESSLESNSSNIGVCAVDTATGRFLLGQFTDDETRTQLKSLLADLRPVELVKPHGLLSEATERALRDHTRKPLISLLMPGTEFWDAKTCVYNLVSKYSDVWESRQSRKGNCHSVNIARGNLQGKYGDIDVCTDSLQALPDVLLHLVTSGSSGEAAVSAFGGCCFYLQQALLDKYLLASGQFSLLPCSACKSSGIEMSAPDMALDSAALDSLEILENNLDRGTSGSLLAQLDYCVTSMGHRLLRQWLLRPLVDTGSIKQRQVAIADLKGPAAEGVTHFRASLIGLPDMERLLAQINRTRSVHGMNSQNVVVYEDKSKREVQMFTKALRSCQTIIEAVLSFQNCLQSLTSPRLLNLLTPGRGIPDMSSTITDFRTAFDWDDADKSGRIMPNEGVNEDFDAANSRISDVEKEFEDYLKEVCKKLGTSSEISYTTVGKESYQIEIPAHLHLKVPSTFEVRSSRKGFQRYWTPRIKELLIELAAAREEREVAMSGILGSLVSQFFEARDKWEAVLHGVAELDALISLSVASDHMEKPVCTPTFVSTSSSNVTPVLKAQGLRHPTLGASKTGCRPFVPNDVVLGGDKAMFMVLTGPNMGGKSTLLREVCLTVIMAQVGADVPAKSFELSPVDRIFVRMGASDNIMAGQSTFLVELLETASMLKSATRNSLVALDEVGRGTSTADGQAIAHAVLQHLAHRTGCRGMFSTHYHRLAFDHANDPMVGLYHMACKVGTEIGGPEEVTFLYKLAAGACPRSYGVNVARLAGLPASVLTRAGTCSAEAESESADNGYSMVQQTGVDIRPTREVVTIMQTVSHGLLGPERTLQLWQQAKLLQLRTV